MGWVTDFGPDPEGLASCVQCGLCLPACPTFRLTGRETASPRGRLQAMSAVADGVASVDSKFEELIGFCLGCRACEPVCPGMVPYGSLLESARAEIVAQQPSPAKKLRGFVLGRVVPSQPMMRLVTWVMALVQRLKLQVLLPRRLRRTFNGLRPLRGRPRSSGISGVPRQDGLQIGLLEGCVQGTWFPEINQAAVELLTMAGHNVVVPQGQTCCGALAGHDGHAGAAERMADRNRGAFQSVDVVVATAAGCSAQLKAEFERAADITIVVSEAITSGRLPQLNLDLGPVTVQDPCHHRHAQRIVDEPRFILEAAGYRVVEIDDPGMCCGAAGLYSVLQPEASAQLGEAKASSVIDAGSRLVASANPGCEMQLRSFLGAGYRVAHPIELYLEAIKQTGPGTNVAGVERAVG